MTNKQKKTLILFAQNYGIPAIARKQEVAKSTIKTRLRQISKSYPEEFDTASAIRESYRRTKYRLKYPKLLGCDSLNSEKITHMF